MAVAMAYFFAYPHRQLWRKACFSATIGCNGMFILLNVGLSPISTIDNTVLWWNLLRKVTYYY